MQEVDSLHSKKCKECFTNVKQTLHILLKTKLAESENNGSYNKVKAKRHMQSIRPGELIINYPL